MGVTVVAVWEEGTPDWAAYIGAQPDPVSEIEAADWTSRFGNKLEPEEAEALMPGITEAMREAGAVSYRY